MLEKDPLAAAIAGDSSLSPLAETAPPFRSAARGLARLRLLTVMAVCCFFAISSSTALAQERLGDSVLDGVLDLLAAEISDEVILDWLATIEEKPRIPSAQDMVALRRGGASDAVMGGLLAKVRGELEAREPRASTAPPSLPPAAPALSTEGPAAADMPTAAGAETAAPAEREDGGKARREDFRLGTRPFETPPPSEAAGLVPAGRGAISARFTLSNMPYWLEGEEPWSLFVYLNGEPLTFVSEGTIFSAKPLRFSKLLMPGKQRLMIFREQHDDDGGRHFAKVMPRKIEFDLEPGGSADIEVSFKQTVISANDPVAYRVAQNDRLVAESSELGGNPDQWDWLCEDLERTLDGKGDSRLEDCVRWRDLWTGFPGPTRSQVLQAFANFDYRPVPRDQNLH